MRVSQGHGHGHVEPVLSGSNTENTSPTIAIGFPPKLIRLSIAPATTVLLVKNWASHTSHNVALLLVQKQQRRY